ncbi:hypothetical protein ACQPYH_23690 [Kribbella sp. CA-245084]|uniref:hypothetical protein n=1 Tax=Kribbella sp. CA-245084 TaxID=3239940 RepID=UPI003D917121
MAQAYVARRCGGCTAAPAVRRHPQYDGTRGTAAGGTASPAVRRPHAYGGTGRYGVTGGTTAPQYGGTGGSGVRRARAAPEYDGSAVRTGTGGSAVRRARAAPEYGGADGSGVRGRGWLRRTTGTGGGHRVAPEYGGTDGTSGTAVQPQYSGAAVRRCGGCERSTAVRRMGAQYGGAAGASAVRRWGV